MAQVIQPCDWHEHDERNGYVVDMYGRLEDENVACVRISGFRPYFYVKGKRPSVGIPMEVEKYDVLAGFQNLEPINVWKVEFRTLKEFKEGIRELAGSILYESNLPPLLRMFHIKHLNPGSAVKFKGKQIPIPIDKETNEPKYNVDCFYECSYTTLEASEVNIPMLVACYDLEMYSESGLSLIHI